MFNFLLPERRRKTTEQEISDLKHLAETAAMAAAMAEAEAKFDPTNAAKAAAAKVTAARAEEAKKRWKAAAEPPVSPTDWRVILLGIYLALTMFLSVYLLAMMTMAEPPEKATGDLLVACCGAEGENCLPSPSPSPSPSPPNTNVNGANDTNTDSGNSIGNTNANANAANNSNANNTANNSTANNAASNASRAANRAANNTNAAGNGAAANKTPAANANRQEFKQDFPEITIPAVVCVKHFNRLPADGYLFLVVLFSGMVGAVARGIFSFVRHQGVKDFSFSWTWFYLFLPFSGAIVSLFLYFIIRGGFYGSPVGKSLVLNLFAFIALGTLSGLFAENAMEKLRQVAEVLLAKVPPKVENAKEEMEKKK